MQLASSRLESGRLAQLRVLGASASAVIVIGSSAATPSIVLVYVGLALLVLAWWRVGKLVHARRGVAVDVAELRRVLCWWAVPLLLAPPLFSRDIYSYLAQGAMVNAGIDVYQHGPATLGGPFAAEVPGVWQHTPAPYGPVFVLYAAAIAAISGTNLALGILGMRLVALLGVALLAWSLPRLADRCGTSPTSALWLGVLNPLVLLHGLAGAHNDAIMLGLLAAGLAVAVVRRPQPWLRLVCAATLISLAALVKVPAVLGLMFLVPLWAGTHTAAPRLRAWLTVAGVVAASAWLVTSAAGTGFGWTRVLGTPVSAGNWSLTSALGRLTGDATSWWRWAGLLAAAAIGIAIWLARERLGPIRALGLAFVTFVVFGPAFRPWYFLWGIVPLAAENDERLRQWLAISSAALVMVVLPDGSTPSLETIAQAALGVTMAVAATRLAQPRLVPALQR